MLEASEHPGACVPSLRERASFLSPPEESLDSPTGIYTYRIDLHWACEKEQLMCYIIPFFFKCVCNSMCLNIVFVCVCEAGAGAGVAGDCSWKS